MADSIGNRIRFFRELRGITQEDLAERCGVSYSSVSRWEIGSMSPCRKNQIKIAAALDIKVDDLYASAELELPPNVIIGEIVKMLTEMELPEQEYMLKQIQLFYQFRVYK